MDNQDQPLDAGLTPDEGKTPGLHITDNIRQYWAESTKWGLFFAVLGFIYIGFLLLGVFGMASMGSGGILVGLFTLLVAGGLIFYPVWLMFQFSQNLKKGLETESTPAANLGFKNLRQLYQFVGILLIIILAFYAIIVIFTLLFASATSGL